MISTPIYGWRSHELDKESSSMANILDNESGNSCDDGGPQGTGHDISRQEDVVEIPQRTNQLRPISSDISASATNASPSQNIQVSPLVAFFTKRGPGPNGLTLLEILDLSDEELENSHNFVQWLFPLNEESKHNLNAPILTNADILIIEKPFARMHVVASVTRFLDFYGMAYQFEDRTFSIKPGNNFAERSQVWATPGNHNLKRITRMIRSCRFFGAEPIANSLHKGFIALKPVIPDVITDTVKMYWDAALNAPLDQRINVSPNVLRVRLA